MAFTPMQRYAGFNRYLGLGKIKVKSKKGSLEHYINEKYDTNFAYIPLNNNNVQKEITQNNLTESNLLWLTGNRYKGEKMDIINAADGIFYLKTKKLFDIKKK